MDRISYIPFLILGVAGLLFIGASTSAPPLSKIKYTVDDTVISQLKKGTRYVLSLDDNESQAGMDRGVLDTLFWVFTDTDGNHSNVYDQSPVHVFPNIGTYIIDTYQLNGSLLATDTITVVKGEYIDFDLAQTSITEGEDVIAYNRSTFKNAHGEWALLTAKGNELLLDSGDTLRVSALNAGTYTVELRLIEKEDTIASQQKTLTVNKKYVAPKPRPRNPIVVAKPSPKPKPKPTPKPKPKPVVKEAPSDGWYRAENGVGKFVIGPPVPKKDDAQFSGGTVVIQILPKADIQLSSFSFWGNHNTGNYSIGYECTTCTDNTQKRLRPFVFRTGNDFYAPQTRYLDSKSIGFKAGHTYKITFITQESTEMQFEKLAKTQYENENVTLEFITDRSSVFGLTFLKRQE